MGLYCVFVLATACRFSYVYARSGMIQRKLIRFAPHIHRTTNNMNHTQAARTIEQWWLLRQGTCPSLRRIIKALRGIPETSIQEYVNKCHSITQGCQGTDGGGLLGGSLNDMLTCEFFWRVFGKDYIELHQGECDFTLCHVPLSFKKIHGKSAIALNWSKNIDESKEGSHFQTHILILNLKTQVWWQRKRGVGLNHEIPSGLYLVDKYFCRTHVTLGKNNKTNSLIDSAQLYSMLRHSMLQDLFVALPEPTERMRICIWDCFQSSL